MSRWEVLVASCSRTGRGRGVGTQLPPALQPAASDPTLVWCPAPSCPRICCSRPHTDLALLLLTCTVHPSQWLCTEGCEAHVGRAAGPELGTITSHSGVSSGTECCSQAARSQPQSCLHSGL